MSHTASIVRTVFFSTTSPRATEQDVEQYLSVCGPVISCRRQVTVAGQQPLWLVEFATEEGKINSLLLNGRPFLDSMVKVQSALNPLAVMGGPMVDATSPVQRTVHVANVNSQVTDEEVSAFFSQMGQVTYLKLAGDEGKPTRFAFVEFATVEGAKNAISQLSGAVFADKQIAVKPSTTAIVKPEVTTNPAVMAPFRPEIDKTAQSSQLESLAKTVYASNIDIAATEDECIAFFNQAGPVTLVKLAGNEVNKPARFAFVEFMEPVSAYVCLNMLNGATFRDKTLKLQQSTTSIIKPEATVGFSDKLKILIQQVEDDIDGVCPLGQKVISAPAEEDDQKGRRRRRSTSESSHGRDRRRRRDEPDRRKERDRRGDYDRRDRRRDHDDRRRR
ncbi:Polyadenylate-binding protein-interacting protein 8 [Diplonema papillatum]|nr:Polyadenylate-binding protein-interacting protein 8 [Diplonema papillatum]